MFDISNLDSFEFTTKAYDGVVYSAIRQRDGGYMIFAKGSAIGSYWNKNLVQHALEHNWHVIPPKNQFSIKKGQIEAAARFIIANNKYMHYHTVDSMSTKIKSYIKDMIDKINSGKESYYCATAGFTISIGLEDTNYYSVEINVDPSVSSDEEYVYVENII